MKCLTWLALPFRWLLLPSLDLADSHRPHQQVSSSWRARGLCLHPTALHHAHRQLRQASTEAQRLKGVIKATSTGLFKLTLPLPAESPATEGYPDECRFFLHPKQPLSFVTSLINSEAKESGLREGERITFHALQEKDAGKRWSGATELGDFVQGACALVSGCVVFLLTTCADAAKDKAFVISLGRSGHDIEVHVPSFKERTDHLRKRLRGVSKEIQNLEGIREQCDQVATGSAKKCAVQLHFGYVELRCAHRIAFLGFGGIALYWVAVYRLTFGPEGYGWDVRRRSSGHLALESTLMIRAGHGARHLSRRLVRRRALSTLAVP